MKVLSALAVFILLSLPAHADTFDEVAPGFEACMEESGDDYTSQVQCWQHAQRYWIEVLNAGIEARHVQCGSLQPDARKLCDDHIDAVVDKWVLTVQDDLTKLQTRYLYTGKDADIASYQFIILSAQEMIERLKDKELSQ